MKINAHVNPKAKVPGVTKIDEITYRVKVDAVPEKGAANRRLLEIIADYFNVPKSSVTIVAGERAKVKIIEIKGK